MGSSPRLAPWVGALAPCALGGPAGQVTQLLPGSQHPWAWLLSVKPVNGTSAAVM